MADVSITEPWTKDPVPEARPSPAQVYGMDVNYSASNSWFAYLPLESVLGSRYANLNLHLTRFSLPQMSMQTTTVSFRGVEKEVSTKVFNPTDKTLTLEYIVDEKWQNYRSLFSWMSCPTGVVNKSTDEQRTGVQPSEYIPLRIYLLDNFKKKVIQFVFENCWIKTFETIALEQNNPGEVTHSFSFAYDRFYIEDLEDAAEGKA
jgi:hypothetical protein